MTEFTSKWLTWEPPETLTGGTAKADKSPPAIPETPRVRTDKTDGRWDPETAALIEWFLGTEPPAGPFELQQAVTVARPDAYWKYLKGDIAAGPNRARGKTGALQDDLRHLYSVLRGGGSTNKG